MNDQERNLIAGLFARLRSAQNAYRDPAAEGYIAEQVAQQPYAPYAMAQTLLVQNQSLEAANARIAELEQELEGARDAGGDDRASPWGPRAGEAMGRPMDAPLGGGGQPMGAPGRFGGQDNQRQGYGGPSSQPYGAQQQQPYGSPNQSYGAPQATPSGGGFLSGALQTAAGVAGGALLYHSLSSLFGGGGEAKAAEAAPAANDAASPLADASASAPDAGAGEGGWFSGLLDGVGSPSDGDDGGDDGSADDGGDGDGWL
jgi:hypothetical protein